MKRPRLHILSVLPSPYQRDLFTAWTDRDEWDTRVFYLEASAPDSPWEVPELHPWETVLPGQTLGKGRVRCHRATSLGSLLEADHWIVNVALTGWTAQRLIRHKLPRNHWHFWGEVLRNHPSGVKRTLQRSLTAPLVRASGIVAIGSRAESDFAARFPQQAIHRVDYAPATAAFTEAATRAHRDPNQSTRAPRILFCGQMIHRKGIDILLQAFAQIHEAMPGAELHLAGRTAEIGRWLPKLSESAQQRVTVHGFVAPDHLPALTTMDLFVLPSRHDGWGVVINQAIAAHLPIVATTTAGAAADLITPPENGLLIPPADSAALRDAMQEILCNTEKREAMRSSQASKAVAMTPDFAARRWVDILAPFRQEPRS